MGQFLCRCGTRPDSRRDGEVAGIYRQSVARNRCAAGHSPFFRFLHPVLHLWYKCSKANESICIIMLYPWNLVSSNPQNLDIMCHSVTWWVLLQESCASSWLPPWERRSTALGLETSNHSISSSEFYTKFEKEKHRETDTWYLQNFDLLLAQTHNHNQPEKILWRQEFCIVRLEVLRQVQVQDAVGRVGYPTRYPTRSTVVRLSSWNPLVMSRYLHDIFPDRGGAWHD